MQPFAPANITGSRTNVTRSDLTLVWFWRARLNAEWLSYVGVPLDEPKEFYDVDIMNGNTTIRTFSGLTVPTVVYTIAVQTADWVGSIPANYTLNVYQISSRYGYGKAGNAVV
jgi:hypothetical protein